jgi:hypothetical protein
MGATGREPATAGVTAVDLELLTHTGLMRELRNLLRLGALDRQLALSASAKRQERAPEHVLILGRIGARPHQDRRSSGWHCRAAA